MIIVITKGYLKDDFFIILTKLVIVKMETQIQFKTTGEEKELIRNSARKVGLGMSPFIRSIILKKIYMEVQSD